MLRLTSCSILLFFAFIHSFNFNALASGADSSGGGELTEDRLNPWFVENTKDIYYCIDSDRAFVQDADALAVLVERAFNFWKRQFALSQYHGYSVKLGEQTLHKQSSCDRNTDIAFQFGKTTAIQREFLPNPRKFIGVAIRTEYNSKTLRGRGFIYISPDNGPQRFEGEGLSPNPWSLGDGVRLYYLLIHELAHIFGLPHMGPDKSILGAGFAEHLIRADDHRSINLSFSRPVDALIFDYDQERIQCGYRRWQDREGLDYLGVTEDCIKFKVNKNATFEVHQAPSPNGSWELAGTIASRSFFSNSPIYGSFATLFLTSENTVFPLHGISRDRLTLLGVQKIGVAGTYVIHKQQQSKPVNVLFLPNEIKIDGVVNGLIRPEIFYLHTK